MSNEEILNTDIIRARITDLEYGKISAEEIRRIYIEETGQEPPGEITVYHSDDLKVLSEKKRAGKDSGFDGTVIHFYDPKQGINQSYTITRGSESAEDNGEGAPLDWVYNGLGIFTGQVKNQYDDAKYFDKTVTEMINKKVSVDYKKRQKDGEHSQRVELEKYGVGHSLGGNHIQMLQLMNNSFKSVYAINDAAPTSYQLAFIDRKFKFALADKFNINPDNNAELYTIPPDQLKAFAEEYYKDRGKDIHHLTAEEDMLYGGFSVRGFLDLGDRKVIDTNEDFDGISKLVENLSDKDVQKIQAFFAKLAPYYTEGGMEGFLDGLMNELTGVDKEFIDLLFTVQKEWWEGPDWTTKKVDMYMPVEGYPYQESVAVEVPIPVPELSEDILSAMQELKQRVATIADKIAKLAAQIPSLIQKVSEVTSNIMNGVISYLNEMKGHAENILKSIGELGKVAIKDMVTPGVPVKDYAVGILNVAVTIKNEADQIREKNKKILNSVANGIKTVKEVLHAVDAHGLTHVASAIAKKDGKRYEGNDMIRFTRTDDGKTIEVNLSSAVRIYQTGLLKYEEKANVLKKMREAYHAEHVEDYRIRKGKLIDSIMDMESNPHAYSYLLPRGNVRMVGISVHEDIQPLDRAFHESFEDSFYAFQEEQRKGMELIQKIRSSIEELFKEDKQIATIFDLR